MALLVVAFAPGLNGTPYWPWRYYPGNFGLFAGLGVGAWALLYAADAWRRTSGRTAGPLALLAALHVALVLGSTALTSQRIAIVGERVRHPDITSYHTEAVRIDDFGALLDEYPDRLRGLIGHAQTHPPGPILYYAAWNALLGQDAGAQWGGMFLALLGGLMIPLLWALGRAGLGSDDAGFSAAALWVPLPAICHMLGSLDAVYPVFTAGLAVLWIRAVWDDSRGSAAGFGALLVLALCFTHSLLTLGALFALLAAVALVREEDRAEALRRAGAAVGIGLVVSVGLFSLLFVVFGYNHVTALLTSMEIQEGLARMLARPWSQTVVWDVYDFFLAAGWLPAPLIMLWLLRLRNGIDGWRPAAFTVAALGTIAIVDLSGLLRAETARVWLFLQPLSIALAGAELARWSPGWRAAAFGVACLALAAIRSRLVFL